MKSVFYILVALLTSTNALAGSVNYIACGIAGNDEYDIALEVAGNKVTAVALLEDDLKRFSQVKPVNGIESVIYVSEYDTNFGYDILINLGENNSLTLSAWTSGNDADNYHATPNNSKTECHLLKDKPTDSVLKAENVISRLTVKSLF
jgi:hypothetical protein